MTVGVVIVFADALHQGEAVELRQIPVADQQIGHVSAAARQRLVAVTGHSDMLRAESMEDAVEDALEIAVAVRDQEAEALQVQGRFCHRWLLGGAEDWPADVE